MNYTKRSVSIKKDWIRQKQQNVVLQWLLCVHIKFIGTQTVAGLIVLKHIPSHLDHLDRPTLPIQIKIEQSNKL